MCVCVSWEEGLRMGAECSITSGFLAQKTEIGNNGKGQGCGVGGGLEGLEGHSNGDVSLLTLLRVT